MKKKILFTFLIMGILPTIGFSKAKITSENEKYRRNSLCTYFLNDMYVDVHQQDAVKEFVKFLINYEIPDKFDDITVDNRFVSIKNIEATDEYLYLIDPDRKKKSKKKGGFLGFMGDVLGNMGSKEEREAREKLNKVGDMWNFMDSHTEVISASSQEEYDENTVQTAAKICKYLVDNKIANKLIAKWFNAKSTKINGSYYDLSYIQDRGSYNAHELEVMRALESNRKWAILTDAGMELIPHTYISFTEFEIMEARNYLEKKDQVYELGKKYWAAKNAELDKYSKKSSSESSSKPKKNSEKKNGMSLGGFLSSIGVNTKMTQEEELDYQRRRLEGAAGYYITSTTYLFQLVWDEKIQDMFIREYWDADVSKLLSSNDFKLKYLGFTRNTVNTETNVSSVAGFNATVNTTKQVLKDGLNALIGVGSLKSSEDYSRDTNRQAAELTIENRIKKNLVLTTQSLVRSIDKTFADLQKNHEDFRVKAPLIDVEKDNITAFIGMKEGVTSKTKFEVLEKVFDEKKGTFKYNKVCTLKVDGKRIWDNRYTLIDEDEGKKKKKEAVDRTYFKGDAGKLAPGMFIRQTK